MDISTTFGVIAGAAYCCGLFLLLLPTITSIATSKDGVLALSVPAVSLMCAFPLGSITTALVGFLVWSLSTLSNTSLRDGAGGVAESALQTAHSGD